MLFFFFFYLFFVAYQIRIYPHAAAHLLTPAFLISHTEIEKKRKEKKLSAVNG